VATKVPFRASDGINTTFINTSQGANIASATTTDIGASTGEYVVVTGTTTITGLGSSLPYAGGARLVTFSGVLILTHNGTSLILPTGANITTQAGDTAWFRYLGSGNWRCAGYLRADGTPLAGGGGGGDASTNTATSVDNELPLFSGTGGKTFKRANALSGFVSLASGVVSAIASTGSGNVVLATGANLVTPTLGVASATSINKVAFTAPATGSTLTIADGKTLTASNTLTFTGTDGSSVAFGAGGTVLYNGGALGTPSSITLTNGTGLPIAGLAGLGTGVGTALAVNVGSAGAFVTFGGAAGTPSSINLANGSALPVSTGISGLGANIATFLATPSSANLAAALTDESGSAGSVIFSGGTPTFTGSPVLNTPTAISLGLAQGLISSATLTTSATTAGQVVLSVAAATYRDIFVRIQVVSGSSYQTFYLSVIHDGTSAWINNFGANQTFTITGTNDLATFDADISAGNLRLLTTPLNAVTVYRAHYEALLV
jgi:hypothetical protein